MIILFEKSVKLPLGSEAHLWKAQIPVLYPATPPSPAHEPWKTPSRSLLAKGRPGLRLVAGGGLGSTSSRLGWAGPTEMQWWGSSGGKKERVSSKDPRSLRKCKDWEPEPGRESIFFY